MAIASKFVWGNKVEVVVKWSRPYLWGSRYSIRTRLVHMTLKPLSISVCFLRDKILDSGLYRYKFVQFQRFNTLPFWPGSPWHGLSISAVTTRSDENCTLAAVHMDQRRPIWSWSFWQSLIWFLNWRPFGLDHWWPSTLTSIITLNFWNRERGMPVESKLNLFLDSTIAGFSDYTSWSQVYLSLTHTLMDWGMAVGSDNLHNVVCFVLREAVTQDLIHWWPSGFGFCGQLPGCSSLCQALYYKDRVLVCRFAAHTWWRKSRERSYAWYTYKNLQPLNDGHASHPLCRCCLDWALGFIGCIVH